MRIDSKMLEAESRRQSQEAASGGQSSRYSPKSWTIVEVQGESPTFSTETLSEEAERLAQSWTDANAARKVWLHEG